MQAFLEMGEMEIVTAMAREAVYRRTEDGRAATIGVFDGVTDPCSVGEALVAACEYAKEDLELKEGLEALLVWAREKAPRNSEGVLYHLDTSCQFWVDSMYMLPPFLAAVGDYDEAWKTMDVYWNALFDDKAGLMCHQWDDQAQRYIRAAHWGTGSGWAMAGMVRLHRLLPENSYHRERERLKERVQILLDHVLPLATEDFLFHDVVDDPATFLETNLAQMTAYTIYSGMEAGWLPSETYKEQARRLREAALSKTDRWGYVHDACGAPTFDKPGYSPEAQAFHLLMETAYQKWREKNE